MPALSRRPLTLALVGAASAAMVLGSTITAQAATPKLKAATLDQVFTALPAAKALPGLVRLTAKLERPGSATVDPCPELDILSLLSEMNGSGQQPALGLTLPGSLVAAAYAPAHAQTPHAKTVAWDINVVVFHSAKLATAAAAKLAAVEKACPKTIPPIPGLPIALPSRTKSAVYKVDGWTGYRTIDQASQLDLLRGPTPVGERVTQVFLTRGNLMLNIAEDGDIEPGTAPRQELWRQSVTRLMLTNLDALLG